MQASSYNPFNNSHVQIRSRISIIEPNEINNDGSCSTWDFKELSYSACRDW